MPHPLDCRDCGDRAIFNLATKEALCVVCGRTWRPTARYAYGKPPVNATDEEMAAWTRQFIDQLMHSRDDEAPTE